MCTDVRRKLTLNSGAQAREILNPPVTATFGELAEHWYTKNAASWSKTHATDVRHKLDAYLMPQLEGKSITSITVQDVIANPFDK